MRLWKKWGMALAALCMAGIAHAQTPNPIAQETLLAYLDQLTQWQRNAAGLEPSEVNARELVFRDSLRENATQVLKSGFTYLRSVAAAQPAPGDSDPESPRVRLTARAKELEQHIASLEGQRGVTTGATRAKLQEQIRLEQAQLELLRTILANMNAASSKSPNKLIYTIDSLTRSIPELNPETIKASSKAAAPAVSAKHNATSILSLAAAIFDVTRKQRELDSVIAETTALKKQSMDMMQSLRGTLGEAPGQSGEGEKEEGAEDAPKAPVLTVEQRIEAYKMIGAHIVPLAETMRWMDASKQTLKEWREVLEQQLEDLLGQLGVHLAILIVALAIPLILSDMAHRGIERIADGKRKRMLNTTRRVLTSIAIVFILLFNFISDFSSFATFAGFMTAGLAVALQSLLLSLVAHFLFYGRYGVRNGDRVNVAGVTGDIMQIGIVRFYLRELKDNGNGLEPTGKIVAFPNSILFQNVAFYKYAG